MISMHFNMITNPGKSREFKQTMDYLITQHDKVTGCSDFNFLQNNSDDNHFMIYTKWRDMKRLRNYLLSDQFMLFQGAIAVLCNPPKIDIASGDRIINISFNSDGEYRGGQIRAKLDAAMTELEDINNKTKK